MGGECVTTPKKGSGASSNGRSVARSGSGGRRRSRRGRGGKGGGVQSEPQHTSVPTGRGAYAETRRWLIERHGPVCAYCDQRFEAKDITLDHVAPRRGQSAYDRRDNLVLACKLCNAAKADMPLLAFLLRNRTRAVSLARHADHLSGMLRTMVRELAGLGPNDHHGGAADPDSPYRDISYREPETPFRELIEDEESPYSD